MIFKKKVAATKKKSVLLAVNMIFATIIAMVLVHGVHADELPPELPLGMVEGEGTTFEVTNSDYLNVTLDSSEAISLTLNSFPEQIYIEFRPISATPSAQVTLSGLTPSATFYMYEDGTSNPVTFTTDAAGSYAYTQDLSSEHIVVIQAFTSTLRLYDNASGGDCYMVGYWNWATKTCTLTQDVFEAIEIKDSGITLNGNGRMQRYNGAGVDVRSVSGVTIRNLYMTSANYLNGLGIYAYQTPNLTISNVTVREKGYGFYIQYSNFIISDSTLDGNRYAGLYITNSGDSTIWNNIISNSIFEGLYLVSTNGISIHNNDISANGRYGLYLTFANDGSIHNNNISDNGREGVFLRYSQDNTIYNNNFLNNYAVGRQAFSNYPNSWYLPAPVGGNYWDHYDTPGEGCYDSNVDRFCDAPLSIPGTRADNLPWTTQDGWDAPPPSDTTPPIITPNVSGTLGNNGWYISNVNVSWTVTDGESAVTSMTGCDPTLINSDAAGPTLTCEATSAGGTASASVTIRRDATAPTASASVSPAPNGNGWNNSDVTVSFSGSDGLSGIASCDAAVVLTAETAGQSASGTCTDMAGNVSAPATATGINIDKTAPTASASVSPAPNSNGWNNTNVTVSFSGSDGLSGIASCDAAVVLTTEGIGQSVSGTCTDRADNVSAPAAATGINIDKTAPALSINTPQLYDVLPLGTALDFSATDALSGLDGAAIATLTSEALGSMTVTSGDQPEPGVYTVIVSASDLAGNTADSEERLLVIYDPSGGFVTGGGWIMSPEGACPAGSICEGATGKANFGFVSKYKRGANLPTGNTEFNFQAGNLNFHSDTYEWLVVNQAGSNAQFKGVGTVNGQGEYQFMIWATDDGSDTFRIKIWDDNTGDIVYDNGVNQTIGGGNIKVHDK